MKSERHVPDQDIRRRYVSADGYLREISSLVEEGRNVVIPVSGISMWPFLIPGRDHVMLGSAQTGTLKVGDIALFQRKSGQYVLHRICRKGKSGFYFVGDAQTAAEGPVDPQQIRARVIGVKRAGKWLTGKEPVSLFFGRVWPRVRRGRARILRVYWRTGRIGDRKESGV